MISAPTMTTPSLPELTDELEQLRQFGMSIAQRLIESTQTMRESGVPPSIALLDELQTYRNRLLKLARGLETDAKGCPIVRSDTTAASPDSEMSFDKLESRIAVRQRVHVADSLRQELSQLKHVDLSDFEPLAHCVRDAARLCELASRPADPDDNAELELLNHHHLAMKSLLRLADDGNQLSDLEWTECNDSVAATYGRQLATAVTRGRIRRVPGETATSNSAVALPSNSQSNPVVIRDYSLIVLSEAPLSDLTASSAPAISHRQSDGIPGTDARPNRKPTSTTIAQIAGSVTPSRPEQVSGMARTATEDAGARALRMSDEIIRLLNEDRLPVALQLTRCLEMRPESSTKLPPSWLLRALILGRHLSYSKGEIAWQLDSELRNFRTELLTEGNADQQMVVGLMLRAAALPAALLAGSTTATGILRAFKIAPGFSQLYNYCSRIASYGDRLDGTLVEMFRPSGTIGGASELETLKATARDWMQNAAKKSTSYSRTSPLFLHAHWTLTAGTAIRHAEATQLWCKWQETMLLAQRLLKPVCQGLDGERNWVRQEITRLTSQIRVEPYDAGQKGGSSVPSAGRGIVLPVEEMHTVLLEAMGIANRWLRLCPQAGPGTALPIPLEAVELRSEVLQRSEAVIEELTQHRRNAESPLMRAAIAYCQAAVLQIESLFESKRSLPIEEPDPLHVLNADLLRIPGLELNEQWLPDSELAVVERELLASLETGELSWRESFEFHSQAGHHDVTGRLLELNVWEDSKEREALRVIRDTQIMDTRTALAAELDDLTTEIALTADAGEHSAADRAAYAQRLEDLRRELPRALNFDAFRRRMNQLHSTLQRRRTPQSTLAGASGNSVVFPGDNRRRDSVESGTPAELTMPGDASPDQESIFHSPDNFSRRVSG